MAQLRKRHDPASSQFVLPRTEKIVKENEMGELGFQQNGAQSAEDAIRTLRTILSGHMSSLKGDVNLPAWSSDLSMSNLFLGGNF